MLSRSSQPVEACCSRRWSLLAGAGLLSLAVLGAGIGLSVRAAPAPEKKAEPEKVEPGVEEPRDKAPFADRAFPGGFPAMPNLERLFEDLPEGALPPEHMEQLRQHMERVREQMDRVMERRGLRQGRLLLPGAGQGMLSQNQGGRLGILVRQPSPTLIEQLDLPQAEGLVIEQVREGSPAAEVGLKPHDILLEINGQPVSHDVKELRRQLEEIKADQEVEVVILRKGRKETLKGMKLPQASKKTVKDRLPGLPFALPQLQGQPFAFGPRDNGAVTSTVRTNDTFTTRHQEGELKIVLEGKVKDGKSQVSTITVEDGDTVNKYDNVDEVPEEYRDRVRGLVEASENANGQIDG